jgi:hypothetical protein
VSEYSLAQSRHRNKQVPIHKVEGIQALVAIEEQDVAAFNNPQSYLTYNRLLTNAAKKFEFELKDNRKAKAAEVARLATVTGSNKTKQETARDFVARRRRGGAK